MAEVDVFVPKTEYWNKSWDIHMTVFNQILNFFLDQGNKINVVNIRMLGNVVSSMLSTKTT